MDGQDSPVVGYRSPVRRRWGMYVLAGLGVGLGVVARGPVMSVFERHDPPAPAVLTLPTPATAPAATGPTLEEVRRLAEERVDPALVEADRASQREVGEHIRAIDDFFAQAKRGTPGFAKQVLGWGSKWRLVSDKLPFTRDDRHAAFLRKAFGERLFTPESLTKAIDQTTRGYGDSLAGIENRMLVRLRADVGDLPPAMLPGFQDDATLRAAFERALAQATARAGADLKADVGRETMSLVAGEVMTLVAVRLGVSAGILATGAGSSWATFGVGAVAGLVVDQVVTWVWNWWRDPVGDLTWKMNQKLDEIHRLIVEGDGESPGLRGRLWDLARERSAVRRAAVLNVIHAPLEEASQR